eukprot:SAG25_NODE_44_length_19254_cov_246.998121_20_plen_65_part_00
MGGGSDWLRRFGIVGNLVPTLPCIMVRSEDEVNKRLCCLWRRSRRLNKPKDQHVFWLDTTVFVY